MSNASNDEARKRYYVANTNRGTARNLEILDEIVALRKEIADLYGVPSYAHYVTKRRMVENPETVTRFLDEVKNVVTEAELSDLRQLAEMKAELTGMPVEQANDRALGRRLLPRAAARAALRRRSGSAARVLPDAADAALDARHHRAAVRHPLRARRPCRCGTTT